MHDLFILYYFLFSWYLFCIYLVLCASEYCAIVFRLFKYITNPKHQQNRIFDVRSNYTKQSQLKIKGHILKIKRTCFCQSCLFGETERSRHTLKNHTLADTYSSVAANEYVAANGYVAAKET